MTKQLLTNSTMPDAMGAARYYEGSLFQKFFVLMVCYFEYLDVR